MKSRLNNEKAVNSLIEGAVYIIQNAERIVEVGGDICISIHLCSDGPTRVEVNTEKQIITEE